MRKILTTVTVLVSLLLIAAPLAAAQIEHAVFAAPPQTELRLDDGTPVHLRLRQNLSSKTNKKGETVDFEVIEEVAVDGVTIIPRNAVALATITDASPKKSMGRGGKLDVALESVRLKDSEKVPLRAVKENKAGGHTGVMTGAMVATAIVFWPAAPLFLFMHGKEMEIPKGTEITAYTVGDIKLDRAKFQ